MSNVQTYSDGDSVKFNPQQPILYQSQPSEIAMGYRQPQPVHPSSSMQTTHTTIPAPVVGVQASKDESTTALLLAILGAIFLCMGHGLSVIGLVLLCICFFQYRNSRNEEARKCAKVSKWILIFFGIVIGIVILFFVFILVAWLICVAIILAVAWSFAEGDM